MPDAKVAVITGCSSGLGLLTAIEFAKNGYYAVATMRDPERRSRLNQAAEKATVRERIDIRQLDVAAFGHSTLVLNNIARDYGHLAVLVNNAGFSMSGFAEDLSLDEYRHQFRDQLLRRRRCEQGCDPHHAPPKIRTHHPGRLGGLDASAIPCSAPTAAQSLPSKAGANPYAWNSTL